MRDRFFYEIVGATFFGICGILLTAHSPWWIAWAGSIAAFLLGWWFMRWVGFYGFALVTSDPAEWNDSDDAEEEL